MLVCTSPNCSIDEEYWPLGLLSRFRWGAEVDHHDVDVEQEAEEAFLR